MWQFSLRATDSGSLEPVNCLSARSLLRACCGVKFRVRAKSIAFSRIKTAYVWGSSGIGLCFHESSAIHSAPTRCRGPIYRALWHERSNVPVSQWDYGLDIAALVESGVLKQAPTVQGASLQ